MRIWRRSQVGGEALQARPAGFHPGTPHQLLGRTLYPYRPLWPFMLTLIISHSSPAFIGHLSMETHCTIPSDCSLLSETSRDCLLGRGTEPAYISVKSPKT